MQYENIYNEFYARYYNKIEDLIKKYWIEQMKDEEPFGVANNEVNLYLTTTFKTKYNFAPYSKLQSLYQMFKSGLSPIHKILNTKLCTGFALLADYEMPLNYDYNKFIKQIALLEAGREIGRMLDVLSSYTPLYYELNDFSEFELRHRTGLVPENYPMFKKLRNKKELELKKSAGSEDDRNYLSSILGLQSNELGYQLFTYLTKWYLPGERLAVKYINILYYLKNNADPSLFTFKIKQKDYKELIETIVGISITKFERSDKYESEQRAILSKLEDRFLKNRIAF